MVEHVKRTSPLSNVLVPVASTGNCVKQTSTSAHPTLVNTLQAAKIQQGVTPVNVNQDTLEKTVDTKSTTVRGLLVCTIRPAWPSLHRSSAFVILVDVVTAVSFPALVLVLCHL